MFQYSESENFHAHPSLQQNKGFVLEALSAIDKSTSVPSSDVRVEQLCDGWWHDREVVLKAVSVRFCGHLLEIAPPEMRADREVVLAAVKSHGYAVQFASEELTRDREIAIAAASLAVMNLQYLCQEMAEALKDDPDFIYEAVKCAEHLYELQGWLQNSEAYAWEVLRRSELYALLAH